MKGVMISIQSEWVEKILNGKKTIVFCKTMPRLKTPFKCYIYCTKPSKKFQTILGSMILNADELYRLPSGEIKHDCSIELMFYDNYTKDNFLNGKIVGEFICDNVKNLDYREYREEYEPAACLLYGWHISDLKIYDKPKELSEFKGICRTTCEACKNPKYYEGNCEERGTYKLTRPFQSWGYVEVKE